MIDTSRVDGAVQRSQEHLLGLQDPAGFWVGELEADSTITSEYLLLRHLLGTVDLDLERKALRYLRERQGADGSWNQYEAGAGDLSATIKAYFAMKMAGRPPHGPGPDAGPRVDPGPGWTDPGERLHEDHARPLRPVSVGWRARDAGRDHALAPVVVLQPLGDLVLVEDGPDPAPHRDGPPARAPRPARPGPGRAVGASPPPRRPGLRPPRLRVVEELLHRRRRLPQDVGGLRAPALAGPRDPRGARLARAPDGRPGWPRAASTLRW